VIGLTQYLVDILRIIFLGIVKLNDICVNLEISLTIKDLK